jgi:hypothetical protein
MQIQFLFVALLGLAAALPPGSRNSTVAEKSSPKPHDRSDELATGPRLIPLSSFSDRKMEELEAVPKRNHRASNKFDEEKTSSLPFSDDEYDGLKNGDDYGKSELHLQDSVFFDPRVDPYVNKRVDWSDFDKSDKINKTDRLAPANKTESQRKSRQAEEAAPKLNDAGSALNETTPKPELPIITGAANVSHGNLSETSNSTQPLLPLTSNSTSVSSAQSSNGTLPTELDSKASNGTPPAPGCSATATVVITPQKSKDEKEEENGVRMRRHSEDEEEDEKKPRVITNAVGQQANCSASITVVLVQAADVPQPAIDQQPMFQTQKHHSSSNDDHLNGDYSDEFRNLFAAAQNSSKIANSSWVSATPSASASPSGSAAIGQHRLNRNAVAGDSKLAPQNRNEGSGDFKSTSQGSTKFIPAETHFRDEAKAPIGSNSSPTLH